MDGEPGARIVRKDTFTAGSIADCPTRTDQYDECKGIRTVGSAVEKKQACKNRVEEVERHSSHVWPGSGRPLDGLLRPVNLP